MLNQLNTLKEKASNELNSLIEVKQLADWHHQYLSKKGELTQFLKQLGKLSGKERPVIGKAANEVKQFLKEQFEKHQENLREAEMNQSLEKDTIDISLPGRPKNRGHLHLITQTLRRIYRIFGDMGFQVYESPEIESDEYNFQLLNIPEYHPARDMWDTFWIDDERVLRTHTSPGQIRIMKERFPEPIRVILPGKVYRFEQITSRSEHQFYQVEGIAISQNITMTDLKGVVIEFAKKLYGPEKEIRIRGSYFPFTEPSIEIDMSCFCNGEGCQICKYTSWLEIGGAGMIHPVVLKNGGYDPAKWSGFAFGLGVERQVMLLHDVTDIRYYYGNDLDFIQQF